jgi:ABC-type antimicrobial peptide transport system permease subunit
MPNLDVVPLVELQYRNGIFLGVNQPVFWYASGGILLPLATIVTVPVSLTGRDDLHYQMRGQHIKGNRESLLGEF